MASTSPERPFGSSRPEPARARSRDELLTHIRTRGDQIRRRRHAAVGALLVIIAAVVIVPLVASPRDDGREVSADGPVTTTTTELVLDEPSTTAAPTTVSTLPASGPVLPQTTTTVSPGDDGGVTSTTEAPSDESAAPAGSPAAGRDLGATPTTRPKGSATTAAPTTTIDPRCRQSFDPACGPFFWTTTPGADATPVMTLTTNPDPPRARQSVTFVFNVRDQDGPVADECFEFETGDGHVYAIVDGRQVSGPVPCAAPSCAAPAGAWTPPSRASDTKSFTIVHTFATTGEFRLAVRARAGGCNNNPYADNFDVSYRISVTN